MSVRAQRPIGVTILVVLMWVQALVSMAFGLFLALEHDNTDLVRHADRSADTLLGVGIGLLVIGALSALFATLLSRGSGFARWIIGFVAILHVAGAVYSFITIDGVTRSTALTEGAVGVAILYILFAERGSDAFFGS